MAPGKSKAKGLSNKVNVRWGGTRATPGGAAITPINKTPSQRAQEKKSIKDQIASLSWAQRQYLFGTDVEMPYTYNGSYNVGGDDRGSDREDIEDDPLYSLPPGQEGYLHSHAGGEGHFHRMLEKVKPGRGDPRTRSLRVQKQIDSWNSQMHLLVNAYLQFMDTGCADVLGEWPLPVVGFDGNFT
ncbi:hypothetical protein C8R43DRAFT_958628 [Mycena crocata]|nr:hypothetical protein C8R43DRAFT_958628 [Mycena crocata]